MALRPYQNQAFRAVRKSLADPERSLVVMPTASGKSHVIAAASTTLSPVLVLQPTQELLTQNMTKLLEVVPESEVGVYSASFNRKEIKKFTFATIQSVYRKPELFRHIKLVLIDECHGVAPRNLYTMYLEFLRRMGSPKVIGFTATAFRLEEAYMWRKDKEENQKLVGVTSLQLINRMRHKRESRNFWGEIIYHVSHKELLDAGYLSPLEYIDKPLLPYEEIPINKAYTDYDLEAYTQSIVGREADIIRTVNAAQHIYKSVLVFCGTAEQARHLSQVIVGSRIVLGETDKKERRKIIEEFKGGRVKVVFNVGVLTTGFDHPALDCVILLRPTRSLVLYNQMLGRLTRLAPGKVKGTVIDLTGTVRALGRIETFELYKTGAVWDLRTEKRENWHNKVLFTRPIEA